jgi:protein involved in polysaccharide export with SLBB domain
MISIVVRIALGFLLLVPAIHSIAQDASKLPRPAAADASDAASMRINADYNSARAGKDEVGGGDKLKVTFFGNADLTGEVRVQSDGTITLPVLGSFFVAGMTTAEIANTIATRFAQDAARASNNVVVEVVEWRPIFVTGGVSKPGSYTYMSGMTALHAISVSGGFYRLAEGDISPFVNAAQNVSRAQDVQEQLKYYLVRLASLTAERAGEATIAAPQRLLELAGESEAKKLLENETRALASRLKATANEQDMRRRQNALLRQELEGYRQQTQGVADSLQGKKQYTRELEQLAARGLSRRPDMLVVEGHVARLEGDRRDLMSQTSRAERDLAKSEQELADLVLQKQIKIDDELAVLRQKIGSSEASLEGALLIVSQLGGGEGSLLTSSRGQPKPTLAILRKVDDKDIFIAAELTTRLQPGDVVVVSGPSAREGAALVTSGVNAPAERRTLPANSLVAR